MAFSAQFSTSPGEERKSSSVPTKLPLGSELRQQSPPLATLLGRGLAYSRASPG